MMSNTSYVENNPDLLAHYNANVAGTGQTMAEFGAQHWENFGEDEGRAAPAKSFTADDYTRTVSSGSEQVSGHDKSGGNYLDYVLTNPDLRENAEALGLTQSEMNEWGEAHWNEWGSRTIESRVNTPFAINNPEARYAEWEIGENVPIVYAGQTIEQVLENSIRAQYKGAKPEEIDYEMWEAREGIIPEWNQGGFRGAGWNMSPDNPYARAIRAGTIDVAEDVGQLRDTGNVHFLQDRYEDDYRANDFPGDWVEDGVWKGPPDLGEYWNAISTAVRDPNTGEISSLIPSTTWTTSTTSPGPGPGPGPGGGIYGPWVDPNISGSPSTASLLEFRPWEADYWATYLPEQMGQISMGAPVTEPSMAYLPGEFRDPAAWRAVLDAPGDLMETIPAGGWANNPATWPSSRSPWEFTSPGGGTNIAQNVWNAPSLGSDAAQKWAGLLADLDTSPAIDTSTQSLLGV
jgi:hypothetical protein